MAFHGHNSPLSNFFRCNITGKNGKVYTSAEQLYSSIMAQENGDLGALMLMEKENNPYSIKAIARKIRVTPEWKTKARATLKEVARMKFTQNPSLMAKLHSYGKAHFYEATFDPVYGCGGHIESAHVITAQGLIGFENVMGQILEEVRSENAPVQP